MQTSVSSRIIVALETVAIIVLAGIVVIYAQVLWQQATQVPPPVTEHVPAGMPPTAAGVTEEERLRVLEELQEGAPAVPLEERAAALEQLEGSAAPASVVTEADRLEVLRTLGGATE